ncbi:MAG: thymidylate synthase [Candidatus Zipacnadales bacterium]
MTALTLPVVHLVAENIAEGWEKAVVACWEQGVCIRTQYDPPDAPPSRDVSLYLVVRNAFAEPRVHRAFPGGIVELEVYRREVVDGIHDHWVDPAAGKWEYTYHERLAAYKVPGLPEPLNQLDAMVDALVHAPYTRRAQAIIWQPWQDVGIHDPACLQRIWARIFDDELVMHIHIRSNDAFKAAFMNMYAFTDLQRVLAERVSERLGRSIRPGQYAHIADSFHIYGAYFEEFKGFLHSLEKRAWEDRTWTTNQIAPLLEEAEEQIQRSLEEEQRTGRKGL